MKLLQKLKPAVPKLWLYAVAGLMWSGVGVFLNKLAYGWLSPLTWGTVIFFVLAGIALAVTIYAFGFAKLANKNIKRIYKLQNKRVCIFAFQQWSSYPLVLFMIMLGISLRNYSPIPKPYLATLYIGIGGSLFLASLHYYLRIFAPSRLALNSINP